MTGRSTAAFVFVALVSAGLLVVSRQVPGFAQTTMPPGPEQTQPRPRPRPPAQPPSSLPPPPGANICTTPWGWCQLPSITAPFGIGCTCLTGDNQEVAGTTRYFPYYGPASPYLQPHTTTPETVR